MPEQGTLLEIASGYGQHAAYFAENLPAWSITPTDIDQENIDVIAERRRAESLENLGAPVKVDAASSCWPEGPFDAVLCINMIHISPWPSTQGLFRGASRVLRAGGQLITYGPYRIANAHTAPSNQAFDQRLRTMDPRFGIRDLEALDALADEHGFDSAVRTSMPANNFVLSFGKS